LGSDSIHVITLDVLANGNWAGYKGVMAMRRLSVEEITEYEAIGWKCGLPAPEGFTEPREGNNQEGCQQPPICQNKIVYLFEYTQPPVRYPLCEEHARQVK
jgi:hypothetical protein